MGAPIKHGCSNHPLYRRWCDIRRRCYNMNCAAYKNYGGRGIAVCHEWENDAGAFIEWCLSNGYEKHLVIDRIDNDGPYSPDNCRFITLADSSRNRREWFKRPKKPRPYKSTNLPVGVYKDGHRYRALASFKNKQTHIGRYNTVEEAQAAYKKAIRQTCGETT